MFALLILYFHFFVWFIYIWVYVQRRNNLDLDLLQNSPRMCSYTLTSFFRSCRNQEHQSCTVSTSYHTSMFLQLCMSPKHPMVGILIRHQNKWYKNTNKPHSMSSACILLLLGTGSSMQINYTNSLRIWCEKHQRWTKIKIYICLI